MCFAPVDAASFRNDLSPTSNNLQSSQRTRQSHQFPGFSGRTYAGRSENGRAEEFEAIVKEDLLRQK
ncbi:uncharacterized protein LOC144473829 isoform X2 [Augochlora pura]